MKLDCANSDDNPPPTKDAYNDIGREQVRVIEQPLLWNTQSDVTVELQPHSVNVLVIK